MCLYWGIGSLPMQWVAKSYWCREGPWSTRTRVFIRRPCKDRDIGDCHVKMEDYSVASLSQGMSRSLADHRKLGRDENAFFSRTVRQYIFFFHATQAVVLCHGCPGNTESFRDLPQSRSWWQVKVWMEVTNFEIQIFNQNASLSPWEPFLHYLIQKHIPPFTHPS